MIVQQYKARQEAQEIATEEMRKQREEELKKSSSLLEENMAIVETADGITHDVSSNLQRIKELAKEASSGMLEKEYSDALQAECEQRCCEVDRLVSGSSMSSIRAHLADGNLVLPVGEGWGQEISVPFQEMSCAALGLDASKINISTPEAAADTIAAMEEALALLGSQLRTLDAVQNRIAHALNKE